MPETERRARGHPNLASQDGPAAAATTPNPPDLILGTLGGNGRRLQHGRDVPDRPRLPAASRSRRLVYGEPKQIVNSGLAYLPDKLRTAYTAVNAAATRAQRAAENPILVLAYSGAISRRSGRTLQPGRDDVAQNRAYLNDVARSLNDVVEGASASCARPAASRSGSSGHAGTFQNGHTYCDDDNWINTLSAEGLLSVADNITGAHRLQPLAWILDPVSIIRHWTDQQIPDNDFQEPCPPNRLGYRAGGRHPNLGTQPSDAVPQGRTARPDRAPHCRNDHRHRARHECHGGARPGRDGESGQPDHRIDRARTGRLGPGADRSRPRRTGSRAATVPVPLRANLAVGHHHLLVTTNRSRRTVAHRPTR